jgi:DNA-binding transcriptional LysR family regulator
MQKNIDFNEISVFVAVVEAGSFTRAAKQLEIPISTTSARVSSLEKRLGITLLQRTTRQLKLTQAGKDYFDLCVRGLADIERAEDFLLSTRAEPHGHLRITAPIYLGHHLLPLILKECLSKYPKMSIEVILKDRSMDLVGEGVDLAIRAGFLKDSSLIAKKVGDIDFMLFASPAYLKRKGTPKHPKDLRDHNCIQFAGVGRNEWTFSNGRSRCTVSVKDFMIADYVNTVKALVLDGNGIAPLPTFMCDKEESREKLVPLLTDWKASSRPIYFVYPPQKYPSLKMRAFMDIAFPYVQKELER